MAQVESPKIINSTNVRDGRMKHKVFSLIVKMLWWVWPSLVEKLVLRLFFSPIKYKINPSEKRLLEQGKKFQIKVRNNLIQCWQWGKGPAIILAHGWNGRGIQFQPLIEALLEANFSVITYDAPGHGDSEGKTSNYFEFTDTLRILWQKVDQNEVHALIGHSLGAGAVLNFISKEKFNKKTILIAPALRLRELLFQTFEHHKVPKMVYLNLVQNLEVLHGYNIFTDNPVQLIKQIKSNILIFHDKDDKAVPYADTKHAVEVASSTVTLETSSGLGHKRILSDNFVIATVVGYMEGKNPLTRSIQKAS